MRHESPRPVKRRTLFARRRFQYAGALVIAAVCPLLLRGTVLPGAVGDVASINALIGNFAAITLAFWMRLSIETYPGIRSTYVIWPAALSAHALVVVTLFLTRLPYDRVSVALGFTLNILWSYFVYFYAEAKAQPRIAIVPLGDVAGLKAIDNVDWIALKRPKLEDTVGCHAIVADFAADLPDEWEAFLADAALAGRIVYQVKQLSESLTGRVELDHLSENSFGSLLPARGYFHLKSLADFLFAVAMLPLVLPVMAVAALAIIFEGGGPALFKQLRLGHAGKIFTAYKFRTMRPLADAGDQAGVRRALATDRDDPRITRVGAVLRRYRIDEIPQIINILRGEMSWIGPRPEPEILTRWFVAEIPFYRYRHVVKPGISGWAQVNQGYVSGVDAINRKLQYDFYYIKYFSPWLDILIVFRTIRTMLTGFGSQ